MFGSNSNNQTTIKRKTKIKEKHNIVDPLQQQNLTYQQQPHLLGNQPLQGPHMIQRNRSSSSSSSSSSEGRRVQQQGLGTQMSGNMMGQNYPLGQNYTTSQNYPPVSTMTNPTYVDAPMVSNQGISGQGVMPPTQTQGTEKVTIVQKVKEKLFHHQ